MRIIIDRDRATIVFGTLLNQFYNQGFPYMLPAARVPQVPENLPRSGFASRTDHACYLFALCLYMRGGIESDRAARAVSQLYEALPAAFKPSLIKDWQPESLRIWLVRLGLGFNSREISRFWVENFRRVHEYWDSDPRTILQGVASYEEACARIRNPGSRRRQMTPAHHMGFLGFQEKMVSMLIYFYMDAGFVDPFHFPIPVDFHVLRVLFATEIVRVQEGNGNHYQPEVLAAIRNLLVSYCQQEQADPLRLCDALWCLSRSLCEYHPGNITMYIGPRRGRQTLLKPKPISWSKGQRQTYYRTCGQCPIETLCRYNIPSAPYYVKGKLVVRGERKKPYYKKHLFE